MYRCVYTIQQSNTCLNLQVIRNRFQINLNQTLHHTAAYVDDLLLLIINALLFNCIILLTSYEIISYLLIVRMHFECCEAATLKYILKYLLNYCSVCIFRKHF